MYLTRREEHGKFSPLHPGKPNHFFF